MDDLSIMIKIGGKLEKSFNDALRAAQTGLSGLNAAVSKEMAGAGDASTAAAMKMADAGKMYAGASRDMAAAARMGATASKGMAAGGRMAATSSKDLASAGKGTAATFKDMATEGMRAADAVRGIASTGKVTAASIQDITSAVKGVVAGFRDMSAQGRMASRAMQAGGQEATSLSTGLTAGGRGIVSLSKDLGKAGELAGAASKGFMVAGAAIAATVATAVIAGKVMKEVAEYSVQVGMEFETAMSDAAATANASTEEFAKMERAAMEMGRTTSKTASESAKALEYMALAGWDADTSISALPSVLKMSEASGMELGQTSDLVTDSMAALGVTVEQLPGYLDVATKAQTKSNQSAQQLMEAYIGVGGTMENLGIPITESATALGVLANRGLKGSEAGNALNAVMVNLTTGTGQAGKMMRELGVSAFDQQGRFIGLEATLQQLDTVLQGYSEEQKNAALAAIGGKQHMDALNALMAGLNTTNEDGISEWAALTSELENCNGSLQQMRDMKLDNLEGDLKTLESATQDAGIKIYKHLNTPLREFAQFGTQAVYQVSDALESDGFAAMAGAAGSALSDGVGMVVERLPEFLATAAVSVGSFLVGFAADLPEDLLVGIIKGAPRLLKALPGLGVDIMKAIIKGIFSLGSAPLRAIGSLLFGGGDEKGADAAGDYPAGIGEDMAVAADTPVSLQRAWAEDTDTAGAALPTGQGGMPPAGLDDSLAGLDTNIPADTTVAPGQMPAGALMDPIPLVDRIDDRGTDMPAAVDAPFVPQAADGLEAGIFGEMGREMRAVGDAPMSIPAGALSIASERATVPQVPADIGGIAVEPQTTDTDTADMGGGPTALPDIVLDMPAGIPQVPPVFGTDIPKEAPQVSPVLELDIPREGPQIPERAGQDMAVDPVQIPVEAAQISLDPIPDVEQMGGMPGMTGRSDPIPDAAMAVPMEGMDRQALPEVPAQDITVPVPGDIRIGDIQIPPVGIGLEGIGDGITQIRDALGTGMADDLAGQVIQILGIDVDGTALSDKLRAIGTQGGQALMDGIGREIGGIIDISQVGVDMTGIDVGRAVQALQIPLQGVVQPVMGGSLSDMVPDMAGGTEDIPGMHPQPVGVPAQGPAEGAGAAYGWIRDITDTIRTALRIPDMDILYRRSVVEETLDALLDKREVQGRSASDTAPTFTINLTVNVEGSGDVEEDVVRAAQMGAREFDRMMQQWMRQNKREFFGKTAWM